MADPGLKPDFSLCQLQSLAASLPAKPSPWSQPVPVFRAWLKAGPQVEAPSDGPLLAMIDPEVSGCYWYFVIIYVHTSFFHQPRSVWEVHAYLKALLILRVPIPLGT